MFVSVGLQFWVVHVTVYSTGGMGLETSVVYRFDTEPIFIDIDGLTCHPPECYHNQGVNLSSVIFAIFSSSLGNKHMHFKLIISILL